MFQRWLDNLSSHPDATFILLGVVALLLAAYLWSATEIRRSHERHMRRIRDTLYISTGLLGLLTIWEHRKYEASVQEHHELLQAMQACKTASCLSPQLQEQIRDCVKNEDPARLALMHKALERECTALSDELSRNTYSVHWGRAIWTILRPAAEPAALTATALLIGKVFYTERIPSTSVDSWDNLLPWFQAISLMLTILYGYLLWSSPKRGTSGALVRWLSLFIALCSLLHLIGLAAAPYALALQLILFVSGFGLTGSRSRSERPYAGHAEMDENSSQSSMVMPVHEAGVEDTHSPVTPRRSASD
ncbi:hypothetical protein M3629_20490 [Paenibacillus polysaccharolyticus]|uniref:hypothetical protein n=1 Tax=Paenibacillus polysaccharolyticus TaxID=582692 RepID=UPI0020412A73|nr:hypothetical protein [Paenibacillus polysaccharolyticus]MCM3135164.1 hypothetical protein [Paenibacillus polysaccharolyticus]